LKQKGKEKNYFCEIRAKKVCSKMDQQQNEQCQKGPQQNGPRQSGRNIKSCTRSSCRVGLSRFATKVMLLQT